MLRRLTGLFSKSVHPVEIKPMARLRFLPNQMPDLLEGGEAIVPEADVERQIVSYIDQIKMNVVPNERNGKDGLYLGCGGVAYMFYHLSKVPALSKMRTRLLADAMEYLQPALKVCTYETNDTDVPAFLLGNCGVYAVAAAVYHATGDEQESVKYRNMYNKAAAICKEMNFQLSGSDELFVGRAGYVCGALWMSKEIGAAFKTEDVFDICRVMVTSGRHYSGTVKCDSPLMYSYYDVEYIGAGHGVCTILQMLLSVPGFLDSNPIDAKAVKDSVDYVLSLQDAEGNFPAATDELRNQTNELIHWCHGAGGSVYLMAKAYLVWKEEKYLESCRAAAELIWRKGLLKKGPGICHGVAGNGYVFLLLYRLTDEAKYLHRAVQFSQFLNSQVFMEKTRRPDHPYSLYEGIAGTACFLGDLLNPKQAAFPFSDVF